ncbi:MAG: glycerol-3-phosphate 1-O-acyltransferase PlsY [Alphaproteobacteria bacterium]|nr:glycerol-3-phosphate 1-O-acyltransferase PlsY [Alphaproteobacteria bacterium]
MMIILSILGGYLAGSIPFGLLLTKNSGLGDIRHIGSGNIGATNVLRTGNKKIAALTLFLDTIKAGIPVFIVNSYFHNYPLACLVGAAAVIGHVFPVWLHFKGGKGVATSLGVYFALSGLFGFSVAAVWILVVKLCRTSSLSALIALGSAPFLAGVFVWSGWGGRDLVCLSVFLGGLSFYTHRQNIQRLWNGEEHVFKK